jgi:hypothetical protein
MAAKTTKSAGSWGRVFVIGGEPFQCEQHAHQAIGEATARRFRRGDGGDTVSSALTEFSMEDTPDAVVVSSPNADVLKGCLDAVESGGMTASALVVVTPGGTLDGRSAFAKAAQKGGRVFYHDYLGVEHPQGLEAFLDAWREYSGVGIDGPARSWLLSNAPTILASVKSASGGSREAEVFDLPWLASELEKPMIVRKYGGGAITLSDLRTYCKFSRAVDAFAVVREAVSGSRQRALEMLDSAGISQANSGVLYLLASQLAFLVGLKSLWDAGVRDQAVLAEKLSSASYYSRYLDDHWREIEGAGKSVNPWRVRKALEDVRGLDSVRLSAQYRAVVSALRDIRTGLSGEVVVPYLVLALAGDVPYDEPLLPIYG